MFAVVYFIRKVKSLFSLSYKMAVSHIILPIRTVSKYLLLVEVRGLLCPIFRYSGQAENLAFFLMAYTLGILDLNTVLVKSLKIWGPQFESDYMFASFFTLTVQSCITCVISH